MVLATGIVPSDTALNLNKDQYGFLTEIQKEGIHTVSCCKKPMDVSASVKDATAAALKAIQASD